MWIQPAKFIALVWDIIQQSGAVNQIITPISESSHHVNH
jgi:hypothetical protein